MAAAGEKGIYKEIDAIDVSSFKICMVQNELSARGVFRIKSMGGGPGLKNFELAPPLEKFDPSPPTPWIAKTTLKQGKQLGCFIKIKHHNVLSERILTF